MFSRLKAAFTGSPAPAAPPDEEEALNPVTGTDKDKYRDSSAEVEEDTHVGKGKSDSGDGSSTALTEDGTGATGGGGEGGVAYGPNGSHPLKRRGVSNPDLWKRQYKTNEFYTTAPFKPLEAKLDDNFFVKLYPLLQVTHKPSPQFSQIFPQKIIEIDDRGSVAIKEYATKAMIKKFASGFSCIRIINIWEAMGDKFQLIVAGGLDEWVRVFDIEGKQIRKIEAPHGGKRITTLLTLLQQPYEDTYFVTGGEDCAVRFWSLKTAKSLFNCIGHRCRIVSTCFAKGQKIPGMAIERTFVVSLDRSGEMRLWDPTDGHCVRVINKCPDEQCEIHDPLVVPKEDEKRKKKAAAASVTGAEPIIGDAVSVGTSGTSAKVPVPVRGGGGGGAAQSSPPRTPNSKDKNSAKAKGQSIKK